MLHRIVQVRRKKPEVKKYRNVFKMLAVKTDSRCTYLVFGIKNPSNTHYMIRVRNVFYNTLQYEKHVCNLASVQCKDRDGGTAGE